MVYPEGVLQRVRQAMGRAAGEVDADAGGVAASFSCGAFVRFDLSVDPEGVVGAADNRTNGCGFMVAAADLLAEYVAGRELVDLHGLRRDELRSLVTIELDECPAEREECTLTAIEALRTAFSNLRAKRVEEFRGEQALICTCFGVTLERLEDLIRQLRLDTVEDVTEASNAGGGCGSCQMLIQELLDQNGL